MTWVYPGAYWSVTPPYPQPPYPPYPYGPYAPLPYPAPVPPPLPPQDVCPCCRRPWVAPTTATATAMATLAHTHTGSSQQLPEPSTYEAPPAPSAQMTTLEDWDDIPETEDAPTRLFVTEEEEDAAFQVAAGITNDKEFAAALAEVAKRSKLLNTEISDLS